MLLLTFEDYQAQGEALAKQLGIEAKPVAVHRFPDGESKVTLPTPLPDEVMICRSMDHPNDKLIELLLAATTAKQLGVKQLTLVAPYLCYMRQDIAFHPGEAVSQTIIGKLLSEQFDCVITVDPHLHRIDHLSQAIPESEAISLQSAPLMGAFLAEQLQHPLLVGPDSESQQWVEAIAKPLGLDFVIANKERRGDREVKIHLPDRNYHQHEVVLVDDMISTGRTLATVAKQLTSLGAEQIHCLVTHALFGDEVTTLLQQAEIRHIWSCDSIPHPTNRVPLAPLLASAIRR